MVGLKANCGKRSTESIERVILHGCKGQNDDDV
jgi:hypothetical protein